MIQIVLRSLSITSIWVLLIGLINVNAQTGDEYSRVGLSVYGGYTIPYENSGLQFFGSNFNVPTTEPTYNFGAGLHYAVKPFWSLEGGYRFNQVESNEGIGFNTTLHTVSFKNILNFNRLYRRNSLSEFINPYGIIGLEHDFYHFESDDQTYKGNESSLIAGAGLAFTLSTRFTLFGQYEFKLASNRLDNKNTGLPYDQLGMVSGGIRINFGKKNAKPLHHSPAVRFLTDAEYDSFLEETEKLKTVQADISAQNQKINELSNKFEDADQQTQSQIESLNQRISRLENRVDSLEFNMSGLKYEMDENVMSELRRTVNAGHYVQVFASREFENSESVKQRFISLMGDRLDDAEEMVFVIYRRGFYEVLVGTFSRLSEAENILEIATDEFRDSFIITFPRPLHLEDAYRGTQIIQLPAD
jgi:opacity protein-like surface antigen/regulator of replication initiation timing